MTALSLYADLSSRGLKLDVRGDGKILVSPPRLLTEADRDLIRQHRAELLALLGEPAAQAPASIDPPACPGRCPGGPACVGCPHPTVELMYPSGLIARQHCLDGPDQGAGWQRRVGAEPWQRIAGRTCDSPTANPEFCFSLLGTRWRLLFEETPHA